MPASPELLLIAAAQPLMLAVAWLMAVLARRLLRGRVTVSGSAMVLVSMLGMCLGLVLVGLFIPNRSLLDLPTLLLVFLIDSLVLVAASAILVTRRKREIMPTIAAMAARGESDQLEFKSSARWNMRTDQRDERMELVIAKTIAAFCNSAGGTLLIGVDDEGRLIGLGPDFATLKQPDPDRFELWLRDLMQTRLGANAAGLPQVDFECTDDGEYVCRMVCAPAPEPVFLRAGKGSSAAPELWVRIGNSSRALGVDDAIVYVRHRWPAPVSTNLRDRLTRKYRRRVRHAIEALPVR